MGNCGGGFGVQEQAGDHVLYWTMNGASGVAIITTIVGWLPPMAAVVALIWYIIQIYESDTIQNWIRGKRVRKIARMKARVLMMEAQNKPDLPDLGG